MMVTLTLKEEEIIGEEEIINALMEMREENILQDIIEIIKTEAIEVVIAEAMIIIEGDMIVTRITAQENQVFLLIGEKETMVVLIDAVLKTMILTQNILNVNK